MRGLTQKVENLNKVIQETEFSEILTQEMKLSKRQSEKNVLS